MRHLTSSLVFILLAVFCIACSPGGRDSSDTQPPANTDGGGIIPAPTATPEGCISLEHKAEIERVFSLAAKELSSEGDFVSEFNRGRIIGAVLEKEASSVLIKTLVENAQGPLQNLNADSIKWCN